MKNTSYLITLLFTAISTMSFAQKELQIHYSAKNGCTSDHKQINSFLRANHKAVLYKESTTSLRGRPGEKREIEISSNHLYRDLKSNIIWSKDIHELVVKEQMNLFKWTFTQVTDTILGYACRKAEANYCGRDYSAWFTTALPFKAAPWKICGLPGVVLKLKSKDGFYSLEASKLKIVDSEEDIKMPFDDNESLTWEEYVDAYKKKISGYGKKIKAMEIKYGRKYNMSYPKIEIIIEKNRNTIDVFLKKEGLI